MAIDKDLLSFVSGLDAAATTAEVSSDSTKGSSSHKKGNRREKQPTANRPLDEDREQQVSLGDLAESLLTNNESSGYGNLKRHLEMIGEEGIPIIDKKRTKRSTKVRVVEVPLPAVHQDRIDRQVAFEQSIQQVNKWVPVVRKNRQAKNLSFPLAAPPAVSLTTTALAAKHQPSSRFEEEFQRTLQEQTLPAGATPSSVTSAPETGLQRLEELAMSKLDPAEVEKRYQDLAKHRSLLFFRERKQKHQSKIKSKTYRKHKNRTKAKLREKEDGLHSEDPQVRQQKRMQAELMRAKERLTLKTRRANKWAQEMLHRGGLDAATRNEIIEQLRDKERLRQEIFGAAAAAASSDEQSEGESDQEDGNYENEEDYDSEAGSEKKTLSDSEEDFCDHDGFKDFFEDEEAAETVKDEASENIDEIVGRRKFNGDGTVSANHTKADRPQQPANDVILTSKLPTEQDELIRRAFAADQLFDADFEAEKKATMEAEQPKQIDLTLPGWGSWTGPGAALPSETDRKKSRVRIVKNVAGVEVEKRQDARLKHVIINEKRSKAARNLYTVGKVPFPYRSREEYEASLGRPLGPEFSAATTFRRRIEPRVRVKVGSIIDPIRFVKQQQQQ